MSLQYKYHANNADSHKSESHMQTTKDQDRFYDSTTISKRGIAVKPTAKETTK